MLCPVSDALSRYSKVPSYALALLGLRQARKKTPRPPDPPDPSGHNFYIGYDGPFKPNPSNRCRKKTPEPPETPRGTMRVQIAKSRYLHVHGSMKLLRPVLPDPTSPVS